MGWSGLGWLYQLHSVGPAEPGSLLQAGLKSAVQGLTLGAKTKREDSSHDDGRAQEGRLSCTSMFHGQSQGCGHQQQRSAESRVKGVGSGKGGMGAVIQSAILLFIIFC